MKLKDILREQDVNESNLSRIWQHISNHDCAIITAFRGSYPKNQNLERNKKLKGSLLEVGCGVTATDGSFIEGYGSPKEREVKENSFFVVNLKSDPNFIGRIIKLGKYFEQDSVLIKEKGNENAYLYGTNDSDFPGLDQKLPVGTFKGGEKSQFMTKIRNRPFIFSEVTDLNLATRGYITSKYKKETLGDE
jgi:hypothetical protein